MTSRIRRISIAILGSRGIPAKYGGYETVVQDLSVGLAKRGFSVYVSCESRGFRMKPYGTYKGVRLVYFPIIGTIRNISETLLYDALSVFWATFVADVTYMVGQASVLTLVLPRALGKAVIVNVDGMEGLRRKFNPIQRYLLRCFDVLSKKVADFVIVDSYAMGRLFQKSFGITTIYVPSGVSEVEPLDPKALQAYGLEKGEYYLVVARLIPDNNINLMIEGFSKSNSRKKLVIVGPVDGSTYAKSLLQYECDRILFLGGIYEQRLQRTLRHNCFAYIHGHEKGGTNPSLVEALSCKNVVIALDVIFNREVAEGSALYFKRDANDLKNKIEMLEKGLVDPRQLADPYEIYIRKYTPEKAVSTFMQLVRKTMKQEVGIQWNPES